MIIKYNLFNESIKSLLVGPTKEEIWKDIEKLDPNKMLITSATVGLIDGVKLALEKGADIHHKKDEALYCSIENENDDITVFLIENGADVNIDNEYPLRMSVHYQNYDLTKLLLDKGADPSYAKGWLISKSEKKGNIKLAELLKKYIIIKN